ncbi:MAG: hypothetical protein ACOYKA_05815 [Legionellaceae bacterium]
MQSFQQQYDEKGNCVAFTLFESYLSQFILEHPHFYQDVFFKVFDTIERFLSKDEPRLKVFIEKKGRGYDIERHIYTLFSRLNEQYPEQTSFETLKTHFSLSSADYFIKLVTDDFLSSPCLLSMSPVGHGSPAMAGMFSKRRSPYKPSRSPMLFSEENRGVREREMDEDGFKEASTHALGIVSDEFLPEALRHYFDKKISPAKFNYVPNKTSYVARWLRRKNLPIISGASGSTEGLITGLLPLTDLNAEEKRVLLFAQACNMVAHGHHSFFEAMMVADHMGYRLYDQTTVLEFYLQCIPESVQSDDAFQRFLHVPMIRSLLEGLMCDAPSPIAMTWHDSYLGRSESFEI